MLLCRMIFFASIATISISAGYKIWTPESDETFAFINATVDILSSCYGNEKFAIGVHGDLPEIFLKSLWSRKLIPMLLINSTRCTHRYLGVYRRPLNVFVIMLNTLQQLSEIFEDIDCATRWSNRLASFLIVDWSPATKFRCQLNRSAQIFHTAWDHRVLNMTVLCVDARKGRMLYSYNPYVDQAPAPWELTESFYTSPKYASLSYFQRKYQQNGVCTNLDFDKVKDVGGYEITYMDQIPLNSGGKVGKFGPPSYRRTLLLIKEFENVGNVFARQIGGTLKLIQPRSRIEARFSLSNEYYDYESSLNQDSIGYPFAQTDILIVTHFHGYKSQLSKILNVVDVYSQYFTFFVLLLTLMIYTFVVRQPVILASLNIFRIISNTALRNLSEDTPSRLYQVVLYLFMITMHGIFAGNLASLLTRDLPIAHPQTIQELVDGNYTIYYKGMFENLFTNAEYKKGKFVPIWYRGRTCIDELLKDLSGGCVGPDYEILDEVIGGNWYVSETPIIKKYRTYYLGYQSVFAGKFNKVLLHMTEADITDTLHMRVEKHLLKYANPGNEGPRTMTLINLIFAFIILGIGLLCASGCFIVEMLIGSVCSDISKYPRDLLNGFQRVNADKINRQKIKVKRLQIRNIKVKRFKQRSVISASL